MALVGHRDGDTGSYRFIAGACQSRAPKPHDAYSVSLGTTGLREVLGSYTE